MAKIIVVGGGIGGLCTAFALQQRGQHVTLYEGAKSFQSLGAGLGIAANALKALDKLELKEQIMKHSKILSKMTILTDKGNVITETDSLLVSERYGTDNVTIHRADLHQVLSDALKPGTTVLNKRCEDFIQDPEGVTVSFADGTTDRADAVVAADGINSLFRRKLLPRSLPRYAGYTCWRAVVSDNRINVDQHAATQTWGPSGRFGIVPLFGGHIYWFACVKADARDPKIAQYGVKDLVNIFKDYHQPIPQIIRFTDNESLIHNDILDIKPIDKFAFQRVVLLGDAAHATTPNLGQGAGQAIEDALVLANCLQRSGDIVTAFANYERERVDRTRQIIKMSNQVGNIAQLQNKLLIQLRNATLRIIPDSVNMKRYKFLYDIDWE